MEKQIRTFPIHIDYIFFDYKNYFYVVTIHFGVVYFYLISVHIAAGSSFIINVEHVCGLLSVTR